MSTTSRDVDVLIIGAGVAGVGMAARLRTEEPDTTVAVLERRERVGGTWDLFRYPGIRSDSDMYTFSYGFKPWHGTKVLADGASIREYVEETATEFDVLPHIRFGRRVTRAEWSSAEGRWTVTATNADGDTEVWTARFLAGCTGYYDYDNGFRPEFPGEEKFGGQLIHPQFWPEDLDYKGKRVVVIGSGATAITLVPAMAAGDDAAEHVTMLQRSPTYVVSLPAEDPVAAALSKARVPLATRFKLGRIRNIALQRASFEFSRKQPKVMRRLILSGIKRQVGPDLDIKHFSPSYNPWDERLCVVPDGDLFKALRSHKADVVTDRIDTFTPTGIRLESGKELEADIVISATGLVVQMFGGMDMIVDGEKVNTRERVLYKALMLDSVPNFVFALGYTNSSWTLKVNLVADWFCRLVDLMKSHPDEYVVAHASEEDKAEESVMGASLQSGYIKRADAVMPRQGTRSPWKLVNSYYVDAKALRRGEMEDGVLEFHPVGSQSSTSA